ncbi:hypothetical protein VK70_04095 [Paenibacillus durus ATCC 35681]|uniref:Uncharacterized protein n=1 Tax=Paenibacillus durus ATCC 35681 TaxID=1333534 RepID=A0A0F7CHN4_PAEDU|nr:hypothetical protein VK70_04095 [Paenibacillus durus ATCC 35681]
MLCGSLLKVLFVDAHFPVDEFETVVQFGNLDGDSLLVFAEDIKSFVLISRALTDQFREPFDLGNRHSRSSELGTDAEPLDIGRAVATAAAVVACNPGGQQQAFAFVESQRGDAQPSALGNLTNT